MRMIASSIMNASGIFTADKTVKYDPAKPVLKFAIGGQTVADLRRLRQAGSGVLCRDRTQICRNIAAKRRASRPSGAVNSTM